MPCAEEGDAISQPVIEASSLIVRQTAFAGRGVFAGVHLAAGVLVEVSHVLLFPAGEYEAHGRFTELDSYTYVWQKSVEGTTMALALGLGSLFNHSSASPNVSYTLDKRSCTIRYRTVRDVFPGEELCISYGTGRMWWEVDEPGAEKVDGASKDDGLEQNELLQLAQMLDVASSLSESD